MTKRRFPQGCWGPVLTILGAGLMLMAFWLGLATAALRPGGMLEPGGKGNQDWGIWINVFGVGAFLLVAGVLLALVQALLWLVHKAMKR